MDRKQNIIGLKFNRWTVLEKTEERNSQNRILFLVRCECGVEKKVPKFDLTSDRSKSCGCYVTDRVTEQNKTHGFSKHPLYPRWKEMNRRCSDPNNSRYRFYGAIGISVCEEWSENPRSFFEWYESQGGDLSLTVDRIDNFKGYSPENCRLVTMQDQMKNRRPKKRLIPDNVVKDIRKMISEGLGPKRISDQTGVSVSLINQIKAGKIYKDV